MPALRPLFAAAGVLLLIALVALAVRSGDGPAVPTAGGTIPPGETADETVDDEPTSPTDDATAGLPSPTPSPDATTRGSDDTVTDDTATDDTATDDTATGTDDTDDTGTDDTATGTDDTATDDTGTDDTATGTGTDDTATDDTGSDSTGAGSESTGSDDGDDEDDREVVAIGGVDDMPDTGGGAAGIVVGALAIGSAAGLSRRR